MTLKKLTELDILTSIFSCMYTPTYPIVIKKEILRQRLKKFCLTFIKIVK